MKKEIVFYLLFLAIAFAPLTKVYPQGSSFKFAWLSDIHIVRGSSHIEDLEKSVSDINSDSSINFTIITGDISDFGYEQDMRIAKSILDRLVKPYYIVPGNHDTKWSESGANVFEQIFGTRNITFTFQDFQFIGFQTGPILRRGDGYITPYDFAWVKKQAMEAKEKGKIIIPFTHYPLTESMSNWYKLVDLFKEFSVPVVLVGHGHRNQAMNFEGLPGVMNQTNPKGQSRSGFKEIGYSKVDIVGDSIYFYERNPEINRATLWHKLSILPKNYAKVIRHLPNLSINSDYPNLKVIWRANMPGGISSSPVAFGKYIIVGDRDGIVTCVSIQSGKVVWKYKTGGAIFSTPATKNDRVVLGSTDGFIYCLNTSNGKLIWKTKTKKWVLGSPIISGDQIFIGGSDGEFRSIDLNSGNINWEYGGIGGWIETKPAISDNKVYFGAWDNYFYALERNTGKLIWKWIRSNKESYPSSFYAPGACWPVITGNRIFICGPDMVLTALDAKSGNVLWRIGNPKLNEAIGATQDGSKILVKCTFDNELLAYDANSNQPKIIWKTIVPYGFDDNQSAILEKDGIAYFTLRNGVAIAVNSNNGNIIWQYKVGDVMLNAATPLGNGKVILTDVDGNILLLGYNKVFE